MPFVIVMPKCGEVLYSTRAMRDLFGFRHDVDHGTISLPSKVARQTRATPAAASERRVIYYRKGEVAAAPAASSVPN